MYSDHINEQIVANPLADIWKCVVHLPNNSVKFIEFNHGSTSH